VSWEANELLAIIGYSVYNMNIEHHFRVNQKLQAAVQGFIKSDAAEFTVPGDWIKAGFGTEGCCIVHNYNTRSLLQHSKMLRCAIPVTTEGKPCGNI